MNADIVFIIVVFAGVAGVGVILLYGAYARREFHRLRSLDHWSKIFFEEVDGLIGNPDLPPKALAILAYINSAIGDARAVPPLWRALLQHRPGPRTSEIDLCEKELRDNIRQAIAVGILAVTYSSWYWGERARALLAGLITESTRDPKPMIDVITTMTPKIPLRPLVHVGHLTRAA